MTPSSRKTSSRRKGRRISGPAVRRLPWLLGIALVVVVCGIGGLKWSRSTGGRAVLLGLGAGRMHADVQQAVEEALVPVLPGFVPGPAVASTALDRPAPAEDPGAVIRCRLVPVAGDRPWWEVQQAVATALAAVGGDVLWGERLVRPGGRRHPKAPDEARELLRLDLGVWGHPTHSLLLHREGRPPVVTWDEVGAPSVWERFAAAPAPTVALVIDDWGYGRNETTSRILALDIPLTLAILPGQSYSRYFALKGTDMILPAADMPTGGPGMAAGSLRRAAGCPVEIHFTREQQVLLRRREIMLHLPMQPQAWPKTDPGPRAVMVGMDRQAMTACLEEALQGLPGVRGVNNHMGSAATSDAATMADFMDVLREHDFYFVDSLTSARSVAWEAARSAGIPAARNRIFLDYDNKDPARIRANLEVLVRSARERGFALGIGHPHSATAAVLESEVPRLQAQGVRFVTVSELFALRQVVEGES